MESWVTIVETDADSWRALGLSESLLKSGTTRNKTAFTGDKVTNEMRYVLGHYFDLVQPLPPQFNLTLDLSTFTPWTKCVLVNPDSFFLQNADEVFESKVVDSANNHESSHPLLCWDRNSKELKRVACTAIVGQATTGERLCSYFASVITFLQEFDANFRNSILSACPYRADLESRTKPVSPRNNELADAIAVVGMSCRFPGANTLEQYWDILKNEEYTVKRFPQNRATFDIPGIEESVVGFLSCDIDAFDAQFFNINPNEAWAVDPQQRLLLEVAWEGLEDAGINIATLHATKTGVFVGNLLQDYERVIPPNHLSGLETSSRVLGNTLSALSGRLSRFLGLTGPSLSHEAGCSSGLGAMHLACESLLRGDCHLAISGAVNLVLLPRAYNTAVLSHDFKCKTFDESADGFVSGEAVGTFVLKRYQDAIRDGDRIRAIVRGTAMSNDGASLCYGTPNPEAHARTHKLALAKAGVQPHEVSYVETHGTGTQKGDIGEIFGLAEAYGVNRKSPLLIGSVKQNIGHGEAAAAVGSMVKLVLALEKEAIPGNIFLTKLNPKIDLESIPARIPTELIPWAGAGRLAGLSSFSLTGSLVHAIFQSPPVLPLYSGNHPLAGEQQLICISAKTEPALQCQLLNYAEFFKQHLHFPLFDVAKATNVGRTHFQHRVGIVAKDMLELIQKLEGGQYIKGVASDEAGGTELFHMKEGVNDLERLAEEYVHGKTLDWSRWFGNCQKVVNLPFYPFQRQKYWFCPTDFLAVMKTTVDADPLLTKIHPLLGYRVPSPIATIFRNQAPADAPIQAGYVVEILLAAAVHAQFPAPPCVTLEEIQVFKGLTPGGAIQTTVQLPIHCRPTTSTSSIVVHQLQGEEWVLIASAVLRHNGTAVVTAGDEKTDESEMIEILMPQLLKKVYDVGGAGDLPWNIGTITCNLSGE